MLLLLSSGLARDDYEKRGPNGGFTPKTSFVRTSLIGENDDDDSDIKLRRQRLVNFTYIPARTVPAVSFSPPVYYRYTRNERVRIPVLV